MSFEIILFSLLIFYDQNASFSLEEAFVAGINFFWF
jgi:hypothetical protein